MMEEPEISNKSNEKSEFTLEPCDKIATLYVMQQKYEAENVDTIEYVLFISLFMICFFFF